MEFEKELIDILDTYTDGEWTVEPLDGDEVDKLIEILRNKLNLLNGNITKDEYDELWSKQMFGREGTKPSPVIFIYLS